ncbi:polysaccharide deacetylase family protein [Candidatus Woesebacteria bacterium]|nr:polysaccharide deacetylase family protein [Candidatus Woesebacteria bacterium]QQG47620.1 MAG: polysaccharide deacetylase family protein [Candidatus Woesebacteria bacterium]
MRKTLIFILAFFVVIGLVVSLEALKIRDFNLLENPVRSPIPSATPIVYPKSYINPTPTPTAKPLSFKELNNFYGPCIYLPTIMYHHIENADVAKAGGFTALNVTTSFFVTHLQYLKDHGYITITPDQIVNFFDQGISPPAKSVLLTFDDAYVDFYVNAYPLLKNLGFHATVFTPTGLVQNNGYLTWDQISEMANSGFIYFANHTWSHKSVSVAKDIVSKEISTADSQLSDKGLNQSKIFAYPYGNPSDFAVSFLGQSGYKLAFTTRPGSTLCKKQRFILPRVRVGNAALSAYGF